MRFFTDAGEKASLCKNQIGLCSVYGYIYYCDEQNHTVI